MTPNEVKKNIDRIKADMRDTFVIFAAYPPASLVILSMVSNNWAPTQLFTSEDVQRYVFGIVSCYCQVRGYTSLRDRHAVYNRAMHLICYDSPEICDVYESFSSMMVSLKEDKAFEDGWNDAVLWLKNNDFTLVGLQSYVERNRGE